MTAISGPVAGTYCFIIRETVIVLFLGRWDNDEPVNVRCQSKNGQPYGVDWMKGRIGCRLESQLVGGRPRRYSA